MDRSDRTHRDLMPPGWPVALPGLLMTYVGPICFVHVAGDLGDEGERTHFTELTRAIDTRARGTRVGVVYDVPVSAGITALARSDIAAMLNQRRSVLAQTTACFALATPSAFVRGMLQAVFWIAPPPYPTAMLPDVEQALVFVAKHLPDLDVAATLTKYASEVAVRAIPPRRAR